MNGGPESGLKKQVLIDWELLTLRCWMPAGSCLWACWGWGWSTRRRRGRIGAPRRRRRSRLSNWRRSSGCPLPVFKTQSWVQASGTGLRVRLRQIINHRRSAQRDIFTSYGSVLALHQSRSICLTFLALGASGEVHFWGKAAAGPALVSRGDKNKSYLVHTNKISQLKSTNSFYITDKKNYLKALRCWEMQSCNHFSQTFKII